MARTKYFNDGTRGKFVTCNFCDKQFKGVPRTVDKAVDIHYRYVHQTNPPDLSPVVMDRDNANGAILMPSRKEKKRMGMFTENDITDAKIACFS